MQEKLVEVICDTSFLINLATKRIKNLDSVNVEIGQLNFVVPNVVLTELEKLRSHQSKHYDINQTLEFAKKLKKIPIDGFYADKEIFEYIKKNGGIVGTLDKKLKKQIKLEGGSILSLSNNRIVLESAKFNL